MDSEDLVEFLVGISSFITVVFIVADIVKFSIKYLFGI